MRSWGLPKWSICRHRAWKESVITNKAITTFPIRNDGRCFKSAEPTAGATTFVTSLRVRHFDGTETDTAEWTHRNALPPQRTASPMPNSNCQCPMLGMPLLIHRQE
ncbi:MAG: hypothetical protein KME31_33885 [Tolypothrix carrinoi HA7290-LM1]|nr:hypothetical protein [Tolypothrix carrinoi HA7290-LM1]